MPGLDSRSWAIVWCSQLPECVLPKTAANCQDFCDASSALRRARRSRLFGNYAVGRGAGVGRGLGIGVALGVAVAVGVGVDVAVAVAVGVGVGVGVA